MTEEPRGSALAGPGWAVAATLTFALLGQPVFYKTDGPDLIRLLHDHLLGIGPLRHPWHLAYLPLLDGLRAMLAACGIAPTLFELGNLFSALGAGLGVGLFRSGLHVLAVPKWTAALATLLLCCNPGTLLFATVVEFHAPLLAAVGLCFFWTAVQIRRPSWAGMLMLGVLCHGAFLMHMTGVLLPAWLLPLFVLHRHAGRAGTIRRDLGLGALALAVHVALFFAMPRLFPGFYGLYADFAAAYARETSIGRPQSLDYTPEILWQEWLWPLLPLSVSVLAGLRRQLRGQLLAFACGFVPFLYLCVRQLVHEPEHGAYLLPLLLPAAMITALALPLRALAALAAISFGLAGWQWYRHQADERPPYDRLCTALATAAAGSPYFALLGPHAEMTIAYARLHPADLLRFGIEPDEFLWIRSQATMLREQALAKQMPAGAAALLKAIHEKGRTVLITQGAIETLEHPVAVMLREKATLEVPPEETMAGPVFLAELRAQFEFRAAAMDPHHEGVVSVYRLVPKG